MMGKKRKEYLLYVDGDGDAPVVAGVFSSSKKAFSAIRTHATEYLKASGLEIESSSVEFSAVGAVLHCPGKKISYSVIQTPEDELRDFLRAEEYH